MTLYEISCISLNHFIYHFILHYDSVCVCVGLFVWPVAVDIMKMISDWWGIPRLVRDTLIYESFTCHV